MNPQTIIIFGRSGSGKGTQANLLLEYFKNHDPNRKILYMETGAKLREFATTQGFTADLTRAIMNEGGLMPEFMPIKLWADFLINNFTGEEHLLLDGLARRPHEAPILDAALKFYKRNHPTIIVLNVSREWAVDRLMSRGRADDNEDDIKARVGWFDTNVVPAVEYFRNNGRFTVLDVNGEQSKEKVSEDILLQLKI